MEEEEDDPESNLSLFRRLMDLRKEYAVSDGEVYYPYHDEDIFSFLRYLQ